MRAGVIIPIAVIVACAVALAVFTYKCGYRDGFMVGKRFILTVLLHVSPEAADRFRREIMDRYQYDIFTEIDKK